MLSEIKQVYKDSRKARDIAWNVYVARPLAAVLVALLRRTPLTPNQVTILGFLVFLLVLPAGLFIPGTAGFLTIVAIVQLAYIFDCADGQLARLKQMTSPAGAYFDFFIDEVKALLLVAVMGVRLYTEDGRPDWLIVALLGAIMVSVATSLTAFVRRPEYSGVDIKPGASAAQPAAPKGVLPKLLWLLQRTASYVVHYPSWILYVGLLDLHPELSGAKIFLGLFLAVYTLYIAKTGLSVLLKLGSPKFYKK
jgi:phosphatidylglycerophosphate synthase